MPQFQTVFYLRESGMIFQVMPGHYVRNKSDKIRCCAPHAIADAAFLYVPYMMPIDTSAFRVMPPYPGAAPMLTDASGLPLYYSHVRSVFRQLLQGHNKISVEFEGGMGDNLLEAAAMVGAIGAYPKTKFACLVKNSFAEVLSFVSGIPPIFIQGSAPAPARDYYRLVMTPQSWTDPRGLDFGKSSMYGLFLDLPRVPYDISFAFPPDWPARCSAVFQKFGIPEDKKIIAMQTWSGSGFGKCWPTTRSIELLKMLTTHDDYHIVYVGLPGALPAVMPGLSNLCGLTSWLEVLMILSTAWHTVCVDTGALHIMHVLDRPYTCLWSNTSPLSILGRFADHRDIIAPGHTRPPDIGAITARSAYDHIMSKEK